MVTEQSVPAANRPYPPPSNVTAILSRLRRRNLPEVVDAEYLRDANIPEGTNARTLLALRFLGLITEAYEPSPALRSIATSTDEEYMSTLADLIREAYADVFVSIDPAQDSQLDIVNFFRRFTPASQRDRMVIFFLGMCREAGIPTLDVPRQRASSASPGRSATQKTAKSPSGKSTRRRDPSLPSSPVPALDGLMRSLPPVGAVFPAARREQWLDMVRATLAFMYLDEPTGQSDVNQGVAAEEAIT